MFNHKEGCKFACIEIKIESHDKYGSSGQEIELNQDGLSYTNDVWTNNSLDKDIEIKFNFCPICGVARTEDGK
jgi:uncharacterized protein (DUF1919 family)